MLFQLGGNLDFPEFLQKKFYNINYWYSGKVIATPLQYGPFSQSIYLELNTKNMKKSKTHLFYVRLMQVSAADGSSAEIRTLLHRNSLPQTHKDSQQICGRVTEP